MKKSLLISLWIASAVLCAAQDTIQCRISTALGDISVELYAKQAPRTVQNFLAYVDQHLYDSSSFFRVCTPANEVGRSIQIEVIQGGNVPEARQLPAIPLETTRQTNVLHTNGTLSMARSDPNSATSEFFICINDQPALDFGGRRNPDGQGFAAFGRVVQGMEVVLRIQVQRENGQYLTTPVLIYSVKRR